MELLSVFHIHRVHDEVIVQMIAVAMCGNDNLIAGKVFGKAQTDFVRGFGSQLVIGAERLDNVVILSAVDLAEFVFYKAEFVKCGLGRAMDSRNQYAVLGLAFVHDIGKNVVHRASRSNEFNDCHTFCTSCLVSPRSTARTNPALTARVS